MSDKLSEWLLTPIGAAVQGYIEAGSWVFPAHGIVNGLCTCGNEKCKSAGKHPFTKNGLKDAVNELEAAAKLFHYRSDLNIGLCTGEASGFFVLDVDLNKSGGESLNKFLVLPDTLRSITGSGYHLFFNYPKDQKIKNSTSALGAGLDIRSNGGYIIAPPSMHANGNQYHFDNDASGNTSDAPQWLLDALRPKEKPPIDKDYAIDKEQKWEVTEVEKMLSMLSPDMDYESWLHVGMALHHGGYNLSLWDNWSRGGQKYKAKDCERRWHAFNPNGEITMGTLVDMAKVRGWTPSPIVRETIDVSNVMPLLEKIKKPRKVSNAHYKIGFDPLKMPGLIGDTVRWINKYAIHKQPELAMLNTLAFAGAVFGRRYASPINTRTNLYIVGTANTASGKDWSRKCITKLAHASGLKHIIGANAIRSDTGMLQGIKNNGTQLMMLDEFGFFLQALTNGNAPHYIRTITKTLLGLYSDSNSIYNHGDYADAKMESIVIVEPNLCIYGTTTENSYIPSLKKSAIESGELNRFIIMPGKTEIEYPERNIPSFEIDEELRLKWEMFSPSAGKTVGEMAGNHNIVPGTTVVGWGDCDNLQYIINCKQTDKMREDSPVRSLWGRFFENCVKIALILAIARDKNNPIMKKEDFDIAQSIVECSIYYLSDVATSSMAETPIEGTHHEIVKAIRDSGGSISRTELLCKFRKIKSKEMDEIVRGMIEQEVITAANVSAEGDAQGRKKTIYTLLDKRAA